MRASLRLGSFAGVNVGMHWSIGLIALILTISLTGTILPATAAGYSSAAYLIAALATAAVFLASIVAHELGHSVVAERSGVRVRGITLFALGGVASLESEPTSPGSAAKIALAGPAVSVAIGVASLGAAALFSTFGLPALAVAAVGWLGVVNLALAVFNMLPALPLDGGRVLQAALWQRSGDQHGSTIRAATIGRYLGWGLVALGVWQFAQGGAGLWTAVIGMFVIATARAEEFRARILRRQQHEQEQQIDPLAALRYFTERGRTYPGDPPSARPHHGQGEVIEVTAREAGTPGVS